jgi:hypothetical protein
MWRPKVLQICSNVSEVPTYQTTRHHFSDNVNFQYYPITIWVKRISPGIHENNHSWFHLNLNYLRRQGEIFIFATTPKPVEMPILPLMQRLPGAFSQRENRLERGTEHCPTSSVKVNDPWTCTSVSPYILKMWCLINHGESLRNMVFD